MTDFSSETMEATSQWDDIFKFLEIKLSTKNSMSGKLSFNNEGKIKMFLDKTWESSLMVGIGLQKMLQAETKGH